VTVSCAECQRDKSAYPHGSPCVVTLFYSLLSKAYCPAAEPVCLHTCVWSDGVASACTVHGSGEYFRTGGRASPLVMASDGVRIRCAARAESLPALVRSGFFAELQCADRDYLFFITPTLSSHKKEELSYLEGTCQCRSTVSPKCLVAPEYCRNYRHIAYHLVDDRLCQSLVYSGEHPRFPTSSFGDDLWIFSLTFL